MARKTKAEAENTRKQIFISALDLFCEKGFSKTSFQDIAKRIGLTKGAVYWHFDNKHDLLAKMILDIYYNGQEKLKQIVPEIKDLDDLKLYLMEETKIILNDPYCKKLVEFVFLQMEGSDKNCDSIKVIVNEFIGNIMLGVEKSKSKGELKDNVNVKTLAITLASFREGLLTKYFENLIDFNFYEALDFGLESIISNCKK